MTGRTHLYQAFYCEENIWHLCQESQFSESGAEVVFISNPRRNCMLWHQKAAAPGSPVFWDYHVIVLGKQSGRWLVFDLDTTLGFPIDCADYLQQTFAVPEVLRQAQRDGSLDLGDPPLFKAVPRSHYVKEFSSDRSHMKTADGQWTAMPPPWEPILKPGGNTLMRFFDMTNRNDGPVLDLQTMFDKFCT